MDFHVDIEGLDSLEHNLDRSAENVKQALNEMRDVSSEPLGHRARTARAGQCDRHG